MTREKAKAAKKGSRRTLYRPGSFASVSSSGGLEVNIKKLLNDSFVKEQIRLLKAVPLSTK